MTRTCWCDSVIARRTSAFLMLINDRAFRFTSWFLGTFISIIWFTILISSLSTLKVTIFIPSSIINSKSRHVKNIFSRRMWVFLLRHAALISFIQNKISPFPMGLDMGHCLSKVLQRKTLVHP